MVGHRGFLGRAMVGAFEGESIRVVGFGIDDPAVREGELNPRLRSAGVRTVVWCASRINPHVAARDPGLVDLDVADFRQFLDLLDSENPPHVVLLSSGGTVYGPPATPPFRETDAVAPVNEYGAAKAQMEGLLREHEVPGTALRVANAYGPGQTRAPGQGVLAHWMAAVRHGEPVVVYGDPAATRDYVFVTDIAMAAVAVHARRSDAPSVVNVGSGESTSLDQLLAALRSAVAPADLEVRREPGRGTDTTHSVLDITLAREALGWSPSVSLVDGVRMQWESTAP